MRYVGSRWEVGVWHDGDDFRIGQRGGDGSKAFHSEGPLRLHTHTASPHTLGDRIMSNIHQIAYMQHTRSTHAAHKAYVCVAP